MRGNISHEWREVGGLSTITRPNFTGAGFQDSLPTSGRDLALRARDIFETPR